MPVVYLEPEDLTATQAARVLAFLNQAGSAEELAQQIEFPDELDIGLRLAQRLLDARTQAGGAFSAIDQIAAVPYIGPERFTEICAAALGLTPGHWSGALNLPAIQSQVSRRDLEKLQSQLDRLLTLGEQVALNITCSNQPAWLGQPLDLCLTAADAQGRRLANRRISLEASLGRLEVAYGMAIQSGPAVEARTGADGSVRFRLHYTPQEPLTADQQAALEDALRRLDPTAHSPHLLQDNFHQIADLYQQERDSTLREALDIYAREGKQRFFDRINASQLGYHWPLELSRLRADYHPEADKAGTAAQAVMTLRWKNWVGAWFEYLGTYLSQKAGLQQAFVQAKQRGATGFRLVNDLIGEAHSFIAGQPGLAAQWLSQQQVKYAMNDFLALETAELDETTQRELFSHLEIASEQLNPGNRGTLSALDQTRTEIDGKFEQIGVLNTGLLEQMLDIQRDVNLKVTKVADAEKSVLEAKTAIDTKVAEFDANHLTASREITNVRTELVEFQTQRAAITQTLDKVTADIDLVKSDIIDIRRG